jgi:hypothetical protein
MKSMVTSGSSPPTTSTETERSLLAYSANCGSRAARRQRRVNAAGSSLATVSSVRAPRPRVEPAARPSRSSAAQPVEDLLEDGPVELLFGLEVPVQDEAGDPARPGDVLHGGVREPGSGEGLGGAPEDRRPALGPGQEFGLDLE